MKQNRFNREIQALVAEVSGNKKTLASFAIAIAALAGAGTLAFSQASPDDTLAATDQTSNTTFQVNVQESISVSVTTPESGATGNVGDFLRNTVDVEVASNVSNGFTASMFSSANNASTTKTDLAHTTLGAAYVIPTLAAGTQRSSADFTDHWGFSLKNTPVGDSATYGETDAGNNNSYYYPLTASSSNPIVIMKGNAGTKSGSQSVYFGAKASANKPSGTYHNTVVINVVTGVIETDSTDPGYNPYTPVNPATPSSDTNATDQLATYNSNSGFAGSATGATVYTTNTSDASAHTNTTTTEVSTGNNTNAYPKGVSVIEDNLAVTNNNTTNNSALATGLAITAGVAATAGTAFFILAKKRDDEDDEEQE